MIAGETARSASSPSMQVLTTARVLTTAPGPFPTGARLIAGETALAEGETHAARFDMYVETDEEGADAFERTPCLLFTLQGGDTGLRATCTEVSAGGFSRALDGV